MSASSWDSVIKKEAQQIYEEGLKAHNEKLFQKEEAEKQVLKALEDIKVYKSDFAKGGEILYSGDKNYPGKPSTHASGLSQYLSPKVQVSDHVPPGVMYVMQEPNGSYTKVKMMEDTPQKPVSAQVQGTHNKVEVIGKINLSTNMSSQPKIVDQSLAYPGCLTIGVHPMEACDGGGELPCVVHNPSKHHMKTWPLFYAWDIDGFVRSCHHGYVHPDPDVAKFIKSSLSGVGHTNYLLVAHGEKCCGCCSSPF